MTGRLIENYLHNLERELKVGHPAKRRILHEIEAHLLEASAEIGEQAAIEQLGRPALVASRFLEERKTPSRRRRIVFAALAAGCLLASAVAIAIVSLTGSPRQLARLGNGEIAALDHNPSPPEPLPFDGVDVASGEGYRVLSDSNRTLWVARGKKNSVCLESVEPDGTAGVGCVSRSALLTGPIYSLTGESSNRASIVGLVDDAVVAIQAPGGKTFRIRHNAFAFDDVPADSRWISLKLFTATGTRSFELPGFKLPHRLVAPVRPRPKVHEIG